MWVKAKVGGEAFNALTSPQPERIMNIALQELFTTDIGLLSLGTIGVVLVIGTYMTLFVRRHIKQDEAAEQARQQH